MDMTREQIDAKFEILAHLLIARNTGQGFATERQGRRHDVQASEFMLMAATANELQFKHRVTRNYVYARWSSVSLRWLLAVPELADAFNRGTFDDYEPWKLTGREAWKHGRELHKQGRNRAEVIAAAAEMARVWSRPCDEVDTDRIVGGWDSAEAVARDFAGVNLSPGH